MSCDRVPTGVDGFDRLIEGGIPRSLVLPAGETGCGKTIFSSQYLYNGLSELHEPGIYVSSAESPEVFLMNAKRMGMDFGEYEQDRRFSYMDFFTVGERGVEEVFTTILAEINNLKARRLVIDSFSALAQVFKEPMGTRIAIHTILSKMIRQLRCTTFPIVERPGGQERVGLGVEEFVADGIVTLTQTTERGFTRLLLSQQDARHTDQWRTTQLRYRKAWDTYMPGAQNPSCEENLN